MADHQFGETQPLLYQVQDPYYGLQEDVINYRNAAIKQLAADVVIVNELFKDTHSLVIEQGDILNNIEYNVENAESNVKKGVEQIVVANKNQKRSRKCLCWFLGGLCVLVFVVLMVVLLLLKR